MVALTRPPTGASSQAQTSTTTTTTGLDRVITITDPANAEYGRYFTVSQLNNVYTHLDPPRTGQAYNLPTTGVAIDSSPQLILIYSYASGGNAAPLTVVATAAGIPAYPALGQGAKCTVTSDGTNPIISVRVCNTPIEDKVVYRPESNPAAVAANWVMSSLSELPIPVGTQFDLPNRQAATSVTFRQLTTAELTALGNAPAVVTTTGAQPVGQPIRVDVGTASTALPTRPANAGAVYAEAVEGSVFWRAPETASTPETTDFTLVSSDLGGGQRSGQDLWLTTETEMDTFRAISQTAAAAQLKIQYWTSRPAETTVQVDGSGAPQTLRPIDLFVTTAGEIPAGAKAWAITNLGENAANAVFQPWSVRGVQLPDVVSSRSEDAAESQDSFEAIPYDPNPTGAATPNTLWVSYTLVV